MANISSGGGGSKKGQPQRINTRVDFTPMVDMNMLLLTFFMFCTTLSKPQTLPLVMPVPDEAVKNDQPADTKASQALTLILGENNKVYYYQGIPDYNDYTTLKETTYPTESSLGIRELLIKGNTKSIEKVRELRKQKDDKKISEEEFAAEAAEVRKDKDGIVVVIKPTAQSTYENLINTLDEMAICSVGRYAVVDPGDPEDYLLQNFWSKGQYGQSTATPK